MILSAFCFAKIICDTFLTITNQSFTGQPPTSPGWEFAVSYQAARQVGGDLYDFFELPAESPQLGLLIADVTGKGVPAALFMAFSRAIIRTKAVTNQMFGQKRLQAIVTANAEGSAEDVCQVILQTLENFTEDTSPSDDITLLILKR